MDGYREVNKINWIQHLYYMSLLNSLFFWCVCTEKLTQNFWCRTENSADHTLYIFYILFFKTYICKRNFKLPSMQRWQCPIYNGTLETLIWSNMLKITSFFYLKSVNFRTLSHCFLCTRNGQVTLQRNRK